MDFSALLSRCDAEVFQKILGRECVRLMGLMDTSMSSPTFVQQLLTDALGESALLLDKNNRNTLLELLRTEEAKNLCDVIGVQSSPNPFKALQTTSFSRGSEKEAALFKFLKESHHRKK